MKTYEVTVPIAGHACVAVEAESRDEAIEKAIEQLTIDDIDTREAIWQFNRGYLCYCPQPWGAETDRDDEDEDEESS